ncbi:hypothetical protein F0L74_08545 [Chitinophaga agrisoli]|uniref:Uncharacterized protein n=1 Tax=Chitinophaga agrisoli TaxID=2607653 RepID=A0A5B2VUX0_9BACT|nr:hypothetical protein [Chitinophaga agrisoli]KAA2242574.1 hypothetical protein F0L74_08545 [Chitinophaga agrisoli]
MKILYVTDHQKIFKASYGFISDYMNDLLFYGLYELFGDDVTDSTQIVSLYKDQQQTVDPKSIWGGFTAFWLIGDNKIDRSDIEQKIKNRYYDLVIYGAINRCDDYLRLVKRKYPANKILLVDGADETGVLPLHNKFPYFKRELTQRLKNTFPISFGIPEQKMHPTPVMDKQQLFSSIIPGVKETYTFKEEQPYYDDYYHAHYGVTTKKAGWDCMRHYEILGNYCLPYFPGLENCPELTMQDFPRELVKQGMLLMHARQFDTAHYQEITDKAYQHTLAHLTTKAVAKKVIDTAISL